MEPDHTEMSSAPLPHFEVLRQELEEDQIRVREFMKGSFTYKVEEKQTVNKVSYKTCYFNSMEKILSACRREKSLSGKDPALTIINEELR